MPVRIAWNEGTVGDWRQRYADLPRPTLTQSLGYARAMARDQGFLPKLGVVEVDGEPLGLVQLLERRLAKLVRQTHLHRGPLWFAGPPPTAALDETLRILRRACPHGLLARASLLPELDAGAGFEERLAAAGFRRVGPGYRTVWLDLARPEEEMRAGLAGPWRKGLKAAEKAGLVVEADAAAARLPWLVGLEHEQARARGFRPVSGRLAVRLRNALVGEDGVLLVTALKDGAPVAAGLFLGHGRGATYQIGWSNETGRRTNAMRLVLWEALRALRGRGVAALDLGGINPESAPGVTEFKLTTGGTAVETVGLYR